MQKSIPFSSLLWDNSGLPVYAKRERVNRYTLKIQYNLDCPQLLWYSKIKEKISWFGSLFNARLGEGKQ